MSLIAWDQSISVNIPSIDTQHQKWIGMINDLYDAMRSGKGKEVVGKILEEMVQYTQTHFAAEERLMRQYGYPEYEQHKLAHDRFVEKVKDLQARNAAGQIALSAEVFTSLKDWLVNHIQTVDRRYAPFLTAKGVR